MQKALEAIQFLIKSSDKLVFVVRLSWNSAVEFVTQGYKFWTVEISFGHLVGAAGSVNSNPFFGEISLVLLG